MFGKFLITAPLMVLAACASLTREQCVNADWTSIGYQDGANGRLESYVNAHNDACSEFGIAPDINAWLRGRAQGLTQYCTRDNAYRIGRNSAGELNPVCTNDVNGLRLSNFYGVRFFQITDQIATDQQEIDTLLGLIAADTGVMPPATKAYYISRINTLRGEISDLHDERLNFMGPAQG